MLCRRKAAQFCYLNLPLFPVFVAQWSPLRNLTKEFAGRRSKKPSLFHPQRKIQSFHESKSAHIYTLNLTACFSGSESDVKGRTWPNLYLLCTFDVTLKKKNNYSVKCGCQTYNPECTGLWFQSHPPPVRLLRFTTDSDPWFLFWLRISVGTD